jgi:hypothetical protein
MKIKVHLAVRLSQVAAALSREEFDEIKPSAEASRLLMCKTTGIKRDQVPIVVKLISKLNRKGFMV